LSIDPAAPGHGRTALAFCFGGLVIYERNSTSTLAGFVLTWKGVAAVNKRLIVLLILIAIILNAIAFVGFGPAFSTYLRSCQSSISSPYTSCSTSASSAVVIGFVLYLSGVIAAIIAWIVGLITTARIRHWGWFFVVLILPVLGSLLYGLIGPPTKSRY
jgi:hypothetical protein